MMPHEARAAATRIEKMWALSFIWMLDRMLHGDATWMNVAGAMAYDARRAERAMLRAVDEELTEALEQRVSATVAGAQPPTSRRPITKRRGS